MTTTKPLRGIVRQQAEERGRLARQDVLLRPIAEAYAELDQAVEEFVAGLPEDALADLEAATTGLTTTNCWWATYHVAPLVRTALQRERFLRERRRSHGVQP